MIRSLHKKPALLLIFLTNILFCILYWRFLCGRAVYMYADIGSDSLSSSYPILAVIAQKLEAGSVSGFSLTAGLGTDITQVLLQALLNPARLLMVLFGEEHLPFGLMISTWFQINLLSFVSFRYLKSLSDDAMAAVAGALAFTFSSWVVVWGQNYTFLTCVLLFMISLYFLHRYLTGAGRRVYLWLIPVYALFIISNYYFFYQAGIFAIIYLLILLIAKRAGLKAILKKLIGLAFMAVFAAALAAVAIVPILQNFFGSSRVSGMKTSLALFFRIYSYPYRYAFLGRSFSANFYGIGWDYSAVVNYYEIALISTTVLFFFAVVYLIAQKTTRKISLILTLITFGALITPTTSYILTFNRPAQRWSYMLCLAEVVALTFFLRDLKRSPDRKALRATLIVTPLYTGIMLLYTYIAGKRAGITFERMTVVTVLILLVLFYLVLFKEMLRPFAKRGLLFALLLGLICFELVRFNYESVNRRVYLTKEMYEDGYYNDGSKEAARALLSSDPELYRMSSYRTDMSLYGNEPMVNGYPGTTYYSSTVPKSVVSYDRAYGHYDLTTNFFLLDYKSYYLFTLLSGRYQYGTADAPFFSGIDPELFEYTDTIAGKEIYRNRNALPFGYLYRSQIPKDEIPTGDFDRMRAVTQGFFYTSDLNENGNASAMTLKAAELPKANEKVKISDYIVDTHDCTFEADGEGIRIRRTGPDPFLSAKGLPKAKAGETPFLHLACYTEEPNETALIPVFFTTTSVSDFTTDYLTHFHFAKEYRDSAMPLMDDMVKLRLDFPENDETFRLDLAVIEYVDAAADFSALADSAVTNISYSEKNATYRADVNVDGESAMFCVPLPYNKGWTAQVNNETVKTENINGGLIGIPLGSGTSTVTLTYRTPHFRAGAAVSLAALLLFVVFYILAQRKDKKSAV